MKRNQIFVIITGIFLVFSTELSAQLRKENTANQNEGTRIAYPLAGKKDYGVFNFGKKVILSNKPDSFKIRISADPRFRLFVNGISIATGPARSDVSHWRYQTIDIADQLINGKNILAAVVWNDGEDKEKMIGKLI